MRSNLFQPVAGVGGLNLTRRQILNASGFVPSDLSGLQVWLETGDYHTIYPLEADASPCEDGEIALTWPDLSINARHFAEAANGPTFQKADTVDALTPRGKNRLVFDAVNDLLRAATAADWRFLHDGAGMTIFCVAYVVTATQNKPLLDTGAWDSQEGFVLWVDDSSNGGRPSLFIRNASNQNVVFAQATAGANVFPDAEWHCIAADYVSGGPGRVWVDGCFCATAAQSNVPSATGPTAALGLCVDDDAGTFGAYGMAALIAYNRVLAESEHRRVAAYLSSHYGFPAGNVACIGDSITAGSATVGVYPTRLAQLLGGLWRVTNFGVNGAVVNEAGVAADLYNDQWLHTTAGAKRRRYNWVVALGGINDIRTTSDSAATIFARYDDMLNDIVADTGTRLVLCTLLPAGNADLWDSVNPDQARLEAYNTLIRAFVAAHPSNTYLVDLYDILGDPSDPTVLNSAYDFDGLHPTQNGMDLVAAAVADKLLAVGLT